MAGTGPERRTSSGKVADGIQIVGAYTLVQIALWSPRNTQQIVAVVAALWILLSSVKAGRGARESGVGLAGLRRSLWIVPAAAAVGALFLLSGWLAGALHDLHGRHQPLWHALLYLVWALVQQFMTQSFLFVRLESVLGSGRRAVFATALLFSAAHIPNEALVVATLALALVLTELFRRYRNLYPLAIAHALLGLAIAVSMPEAATHHMRVGIAYWN